MAEDQKRIQTAATFVRKLRGAEILSRTEASHLTSTAIVFSGAITDLSWILRTLVTA